MSLIYHLVRRDDWEGRSLPGEYSASSLGVEGFNHCSEDEAQLLAVARRLYSGETDLLVLEVETGALASEVKREPSRSGEIYPHIYGPINVEAVAGVRELLASPDGGFQLGPVIGGQ